MTKAAKFLTMCEESFSIKRNEEVPAIWNPKSDRSGNLPMPTVVDAVPDNPYDVTYMDTHRDIRQHRKDVNAYKKQKLARLKSQQRSLKHQKRTVRTTTRGLKKAGYQELRARLRYARSARRRGQTPGKLYKADLEIKPLRGPTRYGRGILGATATNLMLTQGSQDDPFLSLQEPNNGYNDGDFTNFGAGSHASYVSKRLGPSPRGRGRPKGSRDRRPRISKMVASPPQDDSRRLSLARPVGPGSGQRPVRGLLTAG